MFLGSYKPSFDNLTRRLALPKKIRDYLATGEIILSYGFDQCVFGFDQRSWEKESEKQLSEPITDRSARDIRRFFFSSARLVSIDNQGRFVIPGDLLDYAQITSPVVVGAGDHFEIWEEKKWEEQKIRIENQT